MWFSPYLGVGGGGGGLLRGLGYNLLMQFSSFGSSKMVLPLPSSRCLAEGNRILSPKLPNFFLRGPKWSQMLKQLFSQKNCHKAHQVDQRNVLNAEVHVVGARDHFCPERSKVVKIGQNWPAEFVIVIPSSRGDPQGCIGRGGRGPPPPPARSVF